MRDRLVWADAARTLACGLVVLVHVNIYTRAGLETWWPVGFLGVPVFTLAVPTFLVLSGFFAERVSAKTEATPRDSAGRVLRLVLPFLVWNQLTLLALTAEGLPLDTGTVVLQTLTGTCQMYFIFSLLQLMALYRLLGAAAARGRVLALAIATSTAVYTLGDLLLWRIHGADGGAFEMFAERTFFGWAAFFFAGVWLRRRAEAFDCLVGKWLPVLLFALAGAYALSLFELRLEERVFSFSPRKQFLLGGLPFQILAPVLALALLRELERSGRLRGLLERLASAGTDTYGIYLSHAAVLVGVFAAARTLGLATAHWLETPLLAIATWVLSRSLVRLTRRLASGRLAFVVFGEARARAAPPLQLSSSVTTRFAMNAPE